MISSTLIRHSLQVTTCGYTALQRRREHARAEAQRSARITAPSVDLGPLTFALSVSVPPRACRLARFSRPEGRFHKALSLPRIGTDVSQGEGRVITATQNLSRMFRRKPPLNSRAQNSAAGYGDKELRTGIKTVA